jgi:hypothetical protein
MKKIDDKKRFSLCDGYDYVLPEKRCVLQQRSRMPMVICKVDKKNFMNVVKNIFKYKNKKFRRKFLEAYKNLFNLEKSRKT